MKGEKDVSRRGGANRLLVEEGSRGKQDVSRGGGVDRLLVEGVGQTGC